MESVHFNFGDQYDLSSAFHDWMFAYIHFTPMHTTRAYFYVAHRCTSVHHVSSFTYPGFHHVAQAVLHSFWPPLQLPQPCSFPIPLEKLTCGLHHACVLVRNSFRSLTLSHPHFSLSSCPLFPMKGIEPRAGHHTG